MVLPRVLAVHTRDRVRETTVAREMAQRRRADLVGGGMIERVERPPEQHVAREVVRLRERVVRGGLGGRDEPERGPLVEQRRERPSTRLGIAVAQGRIARQARVVGDEKERIQLLVELEGRILRSARGERGAWPPAVDALGDVEGPADEI